MGATIRVGTDPSSGAKDMGLERSYLTQLRCGVDCACITGKREVIRAAKNSFLFAEPFPILIRVSQLDGLRVMHQCGTIAEPGRLAPAFHHGAAAFSRDPTRKP